MTYSLDISKHVRKFLDKQSNKFVQKFMDKAFSLSKDPFKPNQNIKKLEGRNGEHYRLRIGKYRFLYEVIDERVLIYFYDAGSRGDVYK